MVNATQVPDPPLADPVRLHYRDRHGVYRSVVIERQHALDWQRYMREAHAGRACRWRDIRIEEVLSP